MRTCSIFCVSVSCAYNSKLSVYVVKLHANMKYEGKRSILLQGSFLEDLTCKIIVKYVHNKVLYIYIVS